MFQTFFSILGGFVAVFALFKILKEILNQFRLYVFPRICTQKDLVHAYGKWAVITGGSDGIGKGLALALAKRGMNICIISNFENNIVSEISDNHGVKCYWIDVDFTSTDVYDHIKQQLPPINEIGILINNVGIAQSGYQAVAEQHYEYFKKIINVNIIAMVMMTDLVLRAMIEKNKGLIVNMGSLSSKIIFPYAATYSSTKSFVETFSACLAAELRGTNVEVRCIQPWFVKTQILKDAKELTDWLSRYMGWSFPHVDKFAASAAATLGVSSPVFYNGYWTQSLFEFLVPFSYLGNTYIALINEWICRKTIKH